MGEIFKAIFSQDFMPHVHCYLGNPKLVSTMAITDSIIGITYLAITVQLYRLVKKIRIAFSPMILCFAVFIGACGVSHLMDVLTLWIPMYWIAAILNTLTTFASVATAVFLLKSTDRIIAVAEAQKTSEKRAYELKIQAEELSVTNDQLVRSKEKYRLLIENVKDYAIFALDRDGNVLSWNEGARRAKQYTEDEIIGRYFSCFYSQEDVDLGKPEAAIKQAFEQGRFEDEGWRVRKDGSRFWANVIITSIVDPKGAVVGFTKLTRDITEKRHAEEEHERLRVAKQAALESSRLKSEFLAAITHEVRTPINGIVGMATLLHETSLSPQQEDFTTNISLSAKNLLTIVNDILNFSQLENGKIDLEQIDFSLELLLNELSKIYVPLAARKGLTLETFIDPAVSIQIRGDYAKIKQLLMNLISNAIKFTTVGKIVCGVSVESKSTALNGKGILRFEVSDTGVGIPKDSKDKLFAPFCQIDSSASRVQGGVGLGLSTCKKIVDIMGGQIGVEQSPGGGCIFWFTLPLELRSLLNRIPTFSLSDRKGLRILLAEDNLVNQKITLVMLKKLGYTADTAIDGSEALDALKKKSYDLIFMDCQMPKVDGYEATRLIRKKSNCPDIPIVALTANSRTGDREKCLDCGMNDYLSKPVSMEALEQIIEKWVVIRKAA